MPVFTAGKSGPFRAGLHLSPFTHNYCPMGGVQEDDNAQVGNKI